MVLRWRGPLWLGGGLLLLLASTVVGQDDGNVPTWEQLDNRTLPAWYDESKFGIFVHWGVFSVPAWCGEGRDYCSAEWFWTYWKGSYDSHPQMQAYIDARMPPGFTYHDFAKDFTADLFDPDGFADIIDASGARYFVLTSKHHEGFTLWPSPQAWQWNAVDVGPKKDLVALTKAAFQKKPHIHFGLYFSLYEWFNPFYISDGINNRTDYVDQVSYPQGQDVINRYQPEVLWSDGDWERPDTYWRSRQYLNWLYTESPVKDTVVVNDRWGEGIAGKHGGFLTTSDRYDPGVLLARKWENAMTLDGNSWGYRDNMVEEDVLTVPEVLTHLARTIACGGNLLLNIGPDARGRIPVIFESRLRAIGSFVNTNEEAIFGTSPWIYQNETVRDIWYTARTVDGSKPDGVYIEHASNPANVIVYAFIADFYALPTDTILLTRPRANPDTRVELLAKNGTTIPLRFESGSDGLLVLLKDADWRQLPSFDALVLRLTRLAADNHQPFIKETFDRPASLGRPKH